MGLIGQKVLFHISKGNRVRGRVVDKVMMQALTPDGENELRRESVSGYIIEVENSSQLAKVPYFAIIRRVE